MGISRVNPCTTATMPAPKPFPKLMINTRSKNIALFHNNSYATYLFSNNDTRYVVGEKVSIMLEYWEDYNEVLCLKND